MMMNLDIKTSIENFIGDTRKAEMNMERRGLGKVGGFIRIVARRSLKDAGKKGKISRPSEPPRIHSDERELKELLFYSYSPEEHSVVIGPALLNTAKEAIRTTGKTVPEVLEYGGDVGVPLVRLSGGLVVPAESSLAKKANGQVEDARGHIEPRPFMKPAYEEAIAKNKIPESFRGEFNSTSE